MDFSPGIREGTCGAYATLRTPESVEGLRIAEKWPCSLGDDHDGPHEAYDLTDHLMVWWDAPVRRMTFTVTTA